MSTVDLPDPVPDVVAPEPTSRAPRRATWSSSLATLADLRERGMLDDDEYERAKGAVLGEERTVMTTQMRVVLLVLQVVAIAIGIWLGCRRVARRVLTIRSE